MNEIKRDAYLRRLLSAPELQQQATRLETTINLMSRNFYDLVLYRGELRCTHLFNYILVEY